MSGGFKIWNTLHIDYFTTHPHVPAALVTTGLFIAGGIAYRALTPALITNVKGLQGAPEEALIPSEKFSLRNLVEGLSEYVQGKIKDILGPGYHKFLPLLSFVFLWVLVNNMIGMIPGFGSTTDNVNTTFAMGIFVFLYYNILGFWTNGLKYLEHFTGHLHGVLLIALGWLMFPLELISHSVRPLTLGLRLRTNIFVDHLVYEITTGLTGSLSSFLGEKLGFIGTAIGALMNILVPVPIVLLGILVCFVQALVFTLLTSVYISIATAHEEH